MKDKFGQLVDGVIELAPVGGKIGNIWYSQFSEEQYLNDLSCKHIVDKKPVSKDGFDIEFKGYEETEDSIILKYDYVESPVSFKLSKIRLKMMLIKLGIWTRFAEWLNTTEIPLGDDASITCMDAWENCLIIDSGDSMFSEYIQQAKNLFSDVLNADTIQEIISTCKAE